MSAHAVGVVICGMGRSGTSAVTGLFASSGFHVARDEDQMPANVGNPVGYHENLRIWRLNERILDALGGTWYAPPPEERQTASRKRFVGEIEREFAALLAEAGSAPLAVKDPRIDVMVPLWDPVIGTRLHPVLVIRDPVEIAQSLGRRDGTPMPFSLAAWEIHMTTVLRWLRGRAVTVTRYEKLLGSADTARALVADAADQLEPTCAGAVRVSDGATWLDTGLRHNRSRLEDHEELLTTRQAHLWEWLASLDDGTTILGPPEELTVASASARAAVEHEQLRTRITQEALIREEHISALTTQLTEFEVRVQVAEQESARLSHGLDELRAQAAAAVASERDARDELAVVLRSRSWRLASPLRRAARLARRRY